MGKRLLPPTPLGSRLRELRLAKRLTAKEAAKRLGVTPAALFRWETGTRKPDLDSVADLAEVYEVPVSFVFRGLTPAEVRETAPA